MKKRRKGSRPQQQSFVLDGSITLAWAFEDETDAYAEAVADRLPDGQAIVPLLWSLEVANGLRVGERRKRTIAAKTAPFLAFLQSFPLGIDDETALRAWQDTLHLARAHHLSLHDATYLELAVRRRLPLASLDAGLKAAAAAVGVAAFEP